MDIKQITQSIWRKLAPTFVREARREWLHRHWLKSFSGQPPKEVFRRIYEENVWQIDDTQSDGFCSGSGSHTAEFVEAYVGAVEMFIDSLPNRPDVVDLGCGDFAVGSQIRPFCARYIACDVVEPLIKRNKIRYAADDVDFRVLDITSESHPKGDVVFLRQVLQHLSNSQIESTISRIPENYKYLVLTEHLPSSVSFSANLDKSTGPHTRIESRGQPSGVVLTKPPFNLRPSSESVLCESRDQLGTIRTILYEFPARDS